jgi:hypothetical protein
VLGAGIAGATYATLLDAAQTGSGTVLRRVVLHGAGKVDSAAVSNAALQRRMRYAACSLGGSSSTEGAFAQVSWAPSSGNDFELRVVAAAAVAHTSNVRILGRASAGYGSIVITSAGSIIAEENVTPVAAGAASTNGTFKFDGLPHDVRARFTGTSVTITYDGVVVASTTFPTEAWNNTASLTSIGGQWVTSQPRWPGSIHLVELLDLATPANSARFLMDEPPGEDAYVNSYPDTTVGNATKNTGAGYPWSCAVVSHDGRGRVWQGSPTTLFYSATRSGTTAYSGVSTIIVQMTAETLDPTGSLALNADNIFVAPCPGVAWVSATVGLSDNADSGDNGNLALVFGGTTINLGTTTLGVRAEADTISGTYAAPMAAGGALQMQIVDVASATTSLSLVHAAISIMFTPTATTL